MQKTQRTWRNDRAQSRPRSLKNARSGNSKANPSRWYDATVGKWLSQDPIGFTAGDSNLYRYVGNSPADGTDPLGEQFAPYGPGALPLKAYTAAVKKALKGAKRQIRDIGIKHEVEIHRAVSMKDCGTFKSALAVRTLADAYGFDTNGPEDELKRAGVTYELRIEVRWYVRNNGLIEYQVLICADLTVALPSGQPQTTTDYWLTVWGHYDDPNRG